MYNVPEINASSNLLVILYPPAAFCLLRASMKCLFVSRFIGISTTSSARTRRRAARLLWASGTHELPILGVVKEVEEQKEQVDVEIETERAFTQAFVSSAKNATIRRSASRDPRRGSRRKPSTHNCRRRRRLAIANWKPLAART